MVLKSSSIPLPRPDTTGARALERVLYTRRSIREYSSKAIPLGQLAQLLWSCQGITSKDGLRITPSAGATYPLEIFAAVDNVTGLEPGIYHYIPGPKPHEHRLELVRAGRAGETLRRLSSTQEFIAQVPVNIVFASVTERVRREYGGRAPRYVLLEAGHAAQNLHLQAEALGLGSVAIGYVHPAKVRSLLRTDALPVYMVSVGRRARG